MVGSVGCGCCACCSEPTNTWVETFSSTPVADGNPFDVVRNITGPGCRSYPPTTTVKSKVSQLHIKADGSTPLYLGQNGWPRGGKLIAGWGEDATDLAQTPKMQLWSMVVPASKTLANEMSVAIDSRAIIVFGGTEIELGYKVTYRKQVTRNAITGNPAYQYRIDLQAYKKTGSGQPVTEGTRTTDWGAFAYFVGVNFQYRFGGSFFSPDCRSVFHSRGYSFPFGYLQCFDLLNPGFCPLPFGADLTYNSEIFNCHLGWKTDVTWSITSRAAGSGSYSFGSHYVRWYSARWSPLP